MLIICFDRGGGAVVFGKGWGTIHILNVPLDDCPPLRSGEGFPRVSFEPHGFRTRRPPIFNFTASGAREGDGILI